MHQADLYHPNASLQEKLEYIYNLRGDGAPMQLGFREPYLKLLEEFGNPHENLPPVIHVGGTNGKGSVIAMLRSMLQAGGYKVHAYTSPHLIRYNERIVLAGEEITDQYVGHLLDHAVHLNQNRPITFFELTNAIAFKAFAETPADIVLLEVGCGGRLDSTNIISKQIVSVINKISLDHTHILGDSYAKISNEKSGIIKTAAYCILGHQGSHSKVNTILETVKEKARAVNAPLLISDHDFSCETTRNEMLFTMDDTHDPYPEPALLGPHQVHNAGTALAALEVIKDQFPLTHAQKSLGLQNVTWPGRLEKITSGHAYTQIKPDSELWYDGGHNDSAGEALAEQLHSWQAQNPEDIHLIIGMKAGKNFKSFLEPMLPYAASITVIPVPGLGEVLTQEDVRPLTDKNVASAGNAAEAIDNLPSGRVLVTGSLYLAQQLS